MEKLNVQWPTFEAKVKAYAEFFDHTLTCCLAIPLRTIEGLDLFNPEDAVLAGKREGTLNALGLLNNFAVDLVRDLKPRPRTVEDAKRIVGRFRTLAAAPAVLGVESLYEALASRSPHPKEFADRMERLKGFKRDYESFARAANEHLGVEFFRPHVP